MGFKKYSLILVSSILMATEYNPQIDIKEGQKYLKENKTNLAIAAFDRVLIYDKNNDQANFYLAKIFMKIDKNLSYKYYKQIKHPTPQMKKELGIKEAKGKLGLNFYLLFGIFIDSNVNNNSDAQQWDIIVDDSTKTITNDDKTVGIGMYEYLAVDPIYEYKEYIFHSKFSIYNKNILGNADKDLQVFSYQPALQEKIDIYSLKHYLEASYVRYGHEDYKSRFAIGEKVKFDFLKDHTNITNLKLNYNTYREDNLESKDNLDVELNSDVTKHLKYVDVNLGIGLEKLFKIANSNADEYNKYSTKLSFSSKYSIYSLKLSANYYLQQYLDKNSYFDKKQIDHNVEYQCVFTKKAKHVDYQVKYKRIMNNSNITPYDYGKSILEINVIKQFKGM